MFEMGFSEILLVSVLALVILGPERLPKVARNVGLWLGRVQQFVIKVKNELGTQAGMAEFKQAKAQFEAAAQQWQHDADDTLNDIHTGLTDADSRPPWARLPEQRTPADFGLVESAHWPVSGTQPHHVSLHRQALQRKRDARPRPRARPQLRVRRHFSSE